MAWVFELFGAEQMLLVYGLLAGLLSIVAYVPYVVDTVAGRTAPQQASWLVWSVLSVIAVASQVGEGATSSLWFALVQMSGTITVFVLSIRQRFGLELKRSDYVVLGIGALGVALWIATDVPAYALMLTISVSLIGGIPTVVKSFRQHESETLSTWVLSLVAATLALLSVGAIDPVLLAYPLYLFTLYSAFVLAIASGRANGRRLKNA